MFSIKCVKCESFNANENGLCNRCCPLCEPNRKKKLYEFRKYCHVCNELVGCTHNTKFHNNGKRVVCFKCEVKCEIEGCCESNRLSILSSHSEDNYATSEREGNNAIGCCEVSGKFVCANHNLQILTHRRECGKCRETLLSTDFCPRNIKSCISCCKKKCCSDRVFNFRKKKLL